MKKIYVSIPLKNNTNTIIKRYSEACKEIHKMFPNEYNDEGQIYHPYDMLTVNFIHDEHNEGFYKGKDIELMFNCDAIYLGKGWQTSQGCQLAYQFAKIYNKEIVFSND